MRTAEFYTAVLMEHVDVEAMRAARFKVVLDYAYGAASFVMPNVLAKLGAEVLSVNPYASTRQALTFDRWEHATEVSRPGPGVRRRTSARSSTPTASTSPWSTTAAMSSPTTRA